MSGTRSWLLVPLAGSLLACGAASRPASSDLAAANGAACASDAALSWLDQPATALNRRVRDAAQTYLNRYVPNESRHECTDLVAAALRDGGARPSAANAAALVSPRPTSEDYQWGTFLASVESAQAVVPAAVAPGDIIQFRNALFHFTYELHSIALDAAHHSAVVTSISPDRKHLCVIEQNPAIVHYGWYPVTGMTSGVLWFYRPIER